MRPLSPRRILVAVTLLAPLAWCVATNAADDPLPSWNDGPAKQAVLDFVRAATDESGPKFVPSERRIATFDNDGTLWVEQPMYTQIVYCLDRVPAVAASRFSPRSPSCS